MTLVVLIAATFGLIVRTLKQPVILAYILTGILIAVFESFHLGDGELFRTFSQLGVMFLLFMIGLEINYDSLRLVGKTSLIVGIAQLVFTSIIGFGITLFFHFDYLSAAYIAIALTFSSTIIVVKLLSEKKDLNSLYGKISVGFLLVQDVVAILILILLAGVQTGKTLLIGAVAATVLKGAVLTALMFWFGRKVLPVIFHKIARSEELLFLGAVAWCLGVAAAVYKTGFSVEVGGFLAGLALANTAEHYQIDTRIESLRDFFILVFFVILGSSLVVANLSSILMPVVIFSLFVLIGNPLIVLIIMGVMGYRRRTGFLCGVTVAQISEFSLILAAMGQRLGHISNQTVSIITAVGIITITISTYFIIWNEELFRYFNNSLKILERKSKKEEEVVAAEFDKPIILIGAHRVGQNIAASLEKKDMLIIDFDPDVISKLRKQGYACLFGDIADRQILEKSNFKNAKLIISTSPDREDNLRIITEINESANRPKIILRAEDDEDARLFYERGADYVLLPHFTSGQYLGRSISIDPELKILYQLKIKDLDVMKKLNRKFESTN